MGRRPVVVLEVAEFTAITEVAIELRRQVWEITERAAGDIPPVLARSSRAAALSMVRRLYEAKTLILNEPTEETPPCL